MAHNNKHSSNLINTDLDDIAKQLDTKGKQIINNKKRSRKSITPKARNSSAKKIRLNKKSPLPDSSSEETDEHAADETTADEPTADAPWVQKLLNQMATLAISNEKVISHLTNEVQKLKEVITTKDEKIKVLEEKIISNEKTLSSYELRIDNLERAALNESIIITSPEFKSKTLEESVDYVSSVAQIPKDVFLQDSIWKRFGKNGDQLTAKFAYEESKLEFFKCIREKRGQACYISEMLTPKNDQINYEARKLKKAKKVYSVYTFRGQVYVKPNFFSEGVLIREMSELTKYQQLLPTQTPRPKPTPSRSQPDQDLLSIPPGFNPNIPPPMLPTVTLNRARTSHA